MGPLDLVELSSFPVHHADLMPVDRDAARRAQRLDALAGFVVGRQGLGLALLPHAERAEIELVEGNVNGGIALFGPPTDLLAGRRRVVQATEKPALAAAPGAGRSLGLA